MESKDPMEEMADGAEDFRQRLRETADAYRVEQFRRAKVARDPNEHRDGVPWWEAKIPWRLHRCRWQTRGFFRGVTVERCACGAIRQHGDGPWTDRNSRR